MHVLRHRLGYCVLFPAIIGILIFSLISCIGCGDDHTQAISPSSSETARTTHSTTPSYTILTTAPLRAGRAGTVDTINADTPPADSGSGTADSQSTHTDAGSTTTTGRTGSGSTSPNTTVKVVVLTVHGPRETVSLSMADLKAMTATTGFGGWKNVMDNITRPRSFRGVALNALIAMVGGGSTVTVVAGDSYEQNLAPDEIAGKITTYDPSTGASLGNYSGSLTAVVAYELNGAPIGEGDGGPLRIAFLGSSPDQVTDSKLWIKYVSKINVR